jgi:hypothetical protein
MSVLDFQVSSLKPSVVSGLGTSVKYFSRPLGSTITSGQPTTPSSTNATGSLWIPTGPAFNGQLFNVNAVGTFSSNNVGPSGTVTVKLYAVTGSLTSPTYTPLASLGTISPGIVAADPWAISAQLYGDSVSGVLGGSYSAYLGGALVNSTPKSVETAISGLDFVNGNSTLQRGAVCGLVVGVTFGTSDASNQAVMTQFSAG